MRAGHLRRCEARHAPWCLSCKSHHELLTQWSLLSALYSGLSTSGSVSVVLKMMPRGGPERTPSLHRGGAGAALCPRPLFLLSAPGQEAFLLLPWGARPSPTVPQTGPNKPSLKGSAEVPVHLRIRSAAEMCTHVWNLMNKMKEHATWRQTHRWREGWRFGGRGSERWGCVWRD